MNLRILNFKLLVPMIQEDTKYSVRDWQKTHFAGQNTFYLTPYLLVFSINITNLLHILASI